MLIQKVNKLTNHIKTIDFDRLINDLELFTGKKQNKIKINYTLLKHENIYANDFTYFIKI